MKTVTNGTNAGTIGTNAGTIGTNAGTIYNETIEIAATDEEKLLALLKTKPEITQKELHEITGISLRSIKRMMTDLQKKEKVVRVGNNRSGYWKVLL